MTFIETEAWMMAPKQPSELDKQAYRVLKMLGRKMGFMNWWQTCSPENKETIFGEIRDAIRYGDL